MYEGRSGVEEEGLIERGGSGLIENKLNNQRKPFRVTDLIER